MGIGVGAQFFMDGREYSEFLSAYRWSYVLGTVDKTRLKCPDFYRQHVAGLFGGSLGFTGDLPEDQDDALYMMEKHIGPARTPHTVMMAPYGAQPGYLAILGKSLRSSVEMGTEIEAINSLNAEFEMTSGSPGVRFGNILFSPNAEGTITLHERWRITFNNVDVNQFFAFRAVGGTEIAQFQLGSYASDAALRSGVKALLEGIEDYDGKTATVATYEALSGTTHKSTVLDIEWSDNTDLPNLEVLSGAVQSLEIVNGDTDNYSFNGGATFTLPRTEAQMQTNQQALVGQYSAVVTKGQSAANTNPVSMLAGKTMFNWGGDPMDTNTTDGNTATSSAIGSPNPGFQYKFTSAEYIKKIRIFVVSSNGHTLVPVRSLSGGPPLEAGKSIVVPNGAINQWYELTFTNPVLVDATNLLWLQPDSPNTTVIGEVQAFSEAALAAPLNGSLSMKNYFPVAATPTTPPTKTGTGATATSLVAAGSIATTITNAIIQEGGSLEAVNIVSGVTNGARVIDTQTTNPTNKGLVAVIQPTWVSIGGSSTWIIQRETSLNNWSDVIAFDPVTSNDAQYKELPAGTDIQANLRARCSAISGTCVVAMGVARKY